MHRPAAVLALACAALLALACGTPPPEHRQAPRPLAPAETSASEAQDSASAAEGSAPDWTGAYRGSATITMPGHGEPLTAVDLTLRVTESGEAGLLFGMQAAAGATPEPLYLRFVVRLPAEGPRLLGEADRGRQIYRYHIEKDGPDGLSGWVDYFENGEADSPTQRWEFMAARLEGGRE